MTTKLYPTKREFYTDKDGDKWFRVGDTGVSCDGGTVWYRGQDGTFNASFPFSKTYVEPAFRALWTTFERPEVYRVQVQVAQDRVKVLRFTKGKYPRSVRLCGKRSNWPYFRQNKNGVVEQGNFGAWQLPSLVLVSPALEAINHFWGPLTPTSATLPTTDKPAAPLPTFKPETDSWKFSCSVLDLARILREAENEGLHEVTVETKGRTEIFLHKSAYGAVRRWYMAHCPAVNKEQAFDAYFEGTSFGSWNRVRCRMLAETRIWEHAQKDLPPAPKFEVQVTGVK